MSRPCPWCNGGCSDANLDGLITPELAWLWRQIGAASDRRGDPELDTGNLNVKVPGSPEERAAAVGLLGGALRADQQRKVDLADLTLRLRPRGPRLTPGAVAAHATQRRLATRAAAAATRNQTRELLRTHLQAALTNLPDHTHARVDPSTAWSRMDRAGAITKLARYADAPELIAQAGAVLRLLPTTDLRVDRRTLVPGAPHALDAGEKLAWLVLTLAQQPGQRPRHAWDALGIDIDDLTGGLLALGIQPAQWTVPTGAVLTIPPRELLNVNWPPPPTDDSWVFVTENPSVVAAAADRVRTRANGAGPAVQLLCTVGTPSALEAAAIGALGNGGWRVAVRADFDPAGLAHVRTLLAACPTAVHWRMDSNTYRDAARSLRPTEQIGNQPETTHWDPALGPAMATEGVVVFEEDILDQLLGDLLVTGEPG